MNDVHSSYVALHCKIYRIVALTKTLCTNLHTSLSLTTQLASFPGPLLERSLRAIFDPRGLAEGLVEYVTSQGKGPNWRVRTYVCEIRMCRHTAHAPRLRNHLRVGLHVRTAGPIAGPAPSCSLLCTDSPLFRGYRTSTYR